MSMNKDTLKESKAIYLDSEYILVNRTFDEWKAEIIQQAKEEERQRIVEMIEFLAKATVEVAPNGNLPFVVFDGKADEDEKKTIYFQAFKDIINQLSNTK